MASKASIRRYQTLVNDLVQQGKLTARQADGLAEFMADLSLQPVKAICATPSIKAKLARIQGALDAASQTLAEAQRQLREVANG